MGGRVRGKARGAMLQDLFIPVFALGRLPGWTLQVGEQLDRNILIRPLLAYSGPEERAYVPMDKRG